MYDLNNTILAITSLQMGP